MNFVFWTKADTDLTDDNGTDVNQAQYAALHSGDGYSITQDADNENCLIVTGETTTPGSMWFKDINDDSYESIPEEFVSAPGHNPFRPKLDEE